PLLPNSGRIDCADVVHCERSDFLLACAVKHERLSSSGNAINKPAAVSSGNNIGGRCNGSCGIRLLPFISGCCFLGADRSHDRLQRQTADVRLVALEEERTLPVLLHFENLTVIPGRYIESAAAPV